MDEFDFVYEDNDQENEDWFCDDCNMGPIDEEKTKCPRCGFKHHSHREKDVELDEFGEPIDEEFYEKHY